MAMKIADQLKCIVCMMPLVGVIFLSAFLQDAYGISKWWGLGLLVIAVIVVWKIFIKWAT